MSIISSLPRAIGRSPAMSGVIAALLGITIWFLLEKLAGLLGAAAVNPVVDGVYVLLLLMQIGYFVSVTPLIRKAGMECINELQPRMDLTNSECVKLVDRLSAPTKLIRRWSVIAGLIITVVVQESQFERFSLWFAAPDLALGEFWLVGSVWITWTVALSTIQLVIFDVAAVHRIGRDYVSIDLMRIEHLAVFSRYGLRLSSFAVTLMALWAAALVIATSYVSPSWAENSNYTGVLLVGVYLSIAITVFVLPQLGVRQRIRGEKGRVCSQLTQMLPSAQQTLLEADANPERLAALLSSRHQIQGLPEWPAGQHTHIRLAIYLMVPLLSWSAAALVEEVISRLIN